MGKSPKCARGCYKLEGRKTKGKAREHFNPLPRRVLGREPTNRNRQGNGARQ